MGTRICRLEHARTGGEDGPSLADYVTEARALDAWLAQRGLTPHEALAAGLEGPGGLRWTSVELQARAEEDVTAWRWGRLLEDATHAEQRAEQFLSPGYGHIAAGLRADAARYRTEAAEVLARLAAWGVTADEAARRFAEDERNKP
jgi:hypothetical protein